MGLCKFTTKANLVIYDVLLLKNCLFPHNPPSTAKNTNNSHDKEHRQWHEISAHKPCAEGRHAEWKQVHAWGARTSAQEPHSKEGELSGLRQVHTSPTAQRVNLGGGGKLMQVTQMQRNPHKHLPSKFRPAGQGRTEEQKHGQGSQGQVGAGGTADMLRGPLWSSCGNRHA